MNRHRHHHHIHRWGFCAQCGVYYCLDCPAERAAYWPRPYPRWLDPAPGYPFWNTPTYWAAGTATHAPTGHHHR